MSDLRENIHRYMDIKQIKYYSDLLIMIGKELKVKDPYTFAEKEKSNFSKMLKEERPLKHEYIIPLEKIFGVSMARLMDDGAYKIPLAKDDMPYIKGFRYYAYKDDPKLYEDEFERTMITNDGYPTICNSDEFNKTFLDYVIEYRSINALRFLLKKHHFKANSPIPHSFQIDNQFHLDTTMKDELLKMVIQEDDVELFNVCCDYFTCCLIYRMSFRDLNIDLQILEFLLGSKKILNSLFVPKEILFKEINLGVVGVEEETIKILNPILNHCLNYALRDLKKYKSIVKRIIEFGIEYNKEALNISNVNKDRLFVDEHGIVRYGNEVVSSIIYCECETEDEEIIELLTKLPSVKRWPY